MNQQSIIDVMPERVHSYVPFLFDVVNQISLPTDSKVLDVGTGRGLMAIILAAHGYEVTTGEPAEANWADWKTPVNQLHLMDHIQFTPFEVENLPFEPESFDAAFLFATLHHIDSKSDAISNLLSRIKKTGILCITEFTKQGVQEVKKRRPNHPEAVDPREFLKNSNRDEISIETIESKLLNAYIFKKN